MSQGFNYLAIGGSVAGTQIVQQFPVNRLEIDSNGQPQAYRRIQVPVFDRTFDVLVYEPLTQNRAELSVALAEALLSEDARLLWMQGALNTPPAPQGNDQSLVAPTRQQPAVEDNAGR
jgi:hypothetical protein